MSRCPLKPRCTIAPQRTLKVSADHAALLRLRANSRTATFRELYRARLHVIEGIFGEAKQWHRLGRAWRRGLLTCSSRACWSRPFSTSRVDGRRTANFAPDENPITPCIDSPVDHRASLERGDQDCAARDRSLKKCLTTASLSGRWGYSTRPLVRGSCEGLAWAPGEKATYAHGHARLHTRTNSGATGIDLSSPQAGERERRDNNPKSVPAKSPCKRWFA